MLVTYNWLKEFVDFDLGAEELSHRLTMAGLEVEAMEQIGAGLDSVIVARLDAVEAHPDAERLTLCQVNTGHEVIPVVCGATNHKQGDLVALAQVGSVLPGDFKIKKSKIRGAESMGMLCSERELGLADESAGIMILPAHLPLGMTVFAALGLKDVRYEIGLTPNRADCLSVAGIAREVAAIVGEKIKLPGADDLYRVVETNSTDTSVTIEDVVGCPRYMAQRIKGVKVDKSPEWLVKRLESVGMRSINNVVDVTNYVMMELGHPLHAFDFKNLRGQRIEVKKAVDNGSFVTLDGQTRQLKNTDTVICDSEGPVAIAGIMGGENSEVTDLTSDLLLESAYFEPLTIRRTSKRLGIHSESSHRFERGADIDIVPVALRRAATLIQQLAGGTIVGETIDVYPTVLKPRQITITVERTNALLGLDLTLDQIDALLNSIDLTTTTISTATSIALSVTIPMARHDLEREVDLIEEVARLNGYDAIPVTMPVSRVVQQPKDERQKFSRCLRNGVVGLGFSEIINYSFVSPTVWDKIGLSTDDQRRTTVQVMNPLTEEHSVMRTSLLPGMLDVISRNLAYRSKNLKLFELRPVFNVVAGAIQPDESLRMCVAITGRKEQEGWCQNNDKVDFYDLKGAVESLCLQLNLPDLRVETDAEQSYFHPGKSCRLSAGSCLVGTLGEIHPQIQENYDIDQQVYVADLDINALLTVRKKSKAFEPISRFPDGYRDSAFLLDQQISAQQLFDALAQLKIKNLDDVTLFDLYSGKGVPEGKKSLALRARYRSTEKTLTDDEINDMHAKIIKLLQKNLGAEIR